MKPLLEVVDLCVTYAVRLHKREVALSGVSFVVERGETLGILGESGSGKSTLAAALLRILHANGKIERGLIVFEGEDLMQLNASALQRIRGGFIASIFQEPLIALHPAIRVGQQVENVLAAHQPASRRAVREKTLEVLRTVFAKDAERIADSYPHRLSGGQRARVLIAQSIVCRPSLVIADEPTASLDSLTQLEIVALFRSLGDQYKLSMILITHNPFLLAALADRVLVLYAGRVVEIGPTQDVLSSPRHPYTRDLLRCLPPLWHDGTSRKSALPVIPGNSPSPAASHQKCVFEGRCADRMEVCTAREPAAVALTNIHKVSCFKYGG